MSERRRIRTPEEFEALAAPEERTVWRVCYRLLGNAADAEDAVQETMLRAWQHRSRFQGESSVRTWLCSIAVHWCMDRLRQRKRRPQVSLDTLREDGYDPESREPLPQEEVERRDRRERLRQALGELEEDQRVPLVLYAQEQWSYEEIAAALSLPVGTVKSRISRAREKICLRMRAEEGNPAGSPASNKSERRERS